MLEQDIKILFIPLIFSLLYVFSCNAQDPWNYEEHDPGQSVNNDDNIPPDLRISHKKKPQREESTLGSGEWFYRRMLSIVLKGGQVQEKDDGSVDISLQMKLDKKQRDTLDEYIISTSALSEEKYRRSLEYIEESIYKPSLPQKIVMAWSELIQFYLTEYKTEITWAFGALAFSGLVYWIWNRMSHRSAKILVFIALYLYEGFVSYKEFEKKEVDMFVAALNSCKWHIWSSKCEMPKPDPLLFLQHMNPLKIGMRMLTNIVSEPIILLSDTVKTMAKGITDGLWYPFDVIFSGVLIMFFHVILLFFLIMILFNFIFNIRFNLSVLYGLVNVGLNGRDKSKTSPVNESQSTRNAPVQSIENTNNNAINMVLIDKLLDYFSKHIETSNRNVPPQNAIQFQDTANNIQGQVTNSMKPTGMRRSASTGRLPNHNIFLDFTTSQNHVRKRNIQGGSGDA